MKDSQVVAIVAALLRIGDAQFFDELRESPTYFIDRAEAWLAEADDRAEEVERVYDAPPAMPPEVLRSIERV